ncbi:MAG TPA: hypothetical protein VL123_06840 [Candidatus Udaeobacter sp.]|nr:hypothetical protein [Candidatus Udaeobacter sp.]
MGRANRTRRRAVPAAAGAAIALGVLTLLWPAMARAYRPFDLTDADVAQRHHIELELGPVEYLARGDDRLLHAPSAVLNYGADGSREFSAEAARLMPEGGGPAQFGDFRLSYKQILRRGTLQDGRGPSLATEWAMLVPLRDDPHAGASLALILSTRSPRGYAHVNSEVERDREGINALETGVILERGDQEGVGPVMELEGNAEDGEPPGGSVLIGLVYVPRAGFEWDVGVREGSVAGAHVLELRSGLTWQFSTHEAVAKAKEMAPGRRRRH